MKMQLARCLALALGLSIVVTTGCGGSGHDSDRGACVTREDCQDGVSRAQCNGTDGDFHAWTGCGELIQLEILILD